MDNNSFEELLHHLLLSGSLAEFGHLSDRRLLQRYVGDHDQNALGEVVRRHGDMVWAICYGILGQSQEAKDVYQVSFLKLMRQAIFLKQRNGIVGWLYTVARSAASNVKRQGDDRKKSCEKRRARMYEEDYPDSPDTENLAAILDEEVDYLPERLKSPIIMCYFEGLTHEQAARRINTSTHYLKLQLAEGRQWLHHRLSKRGITLDSPLLVAGLIAELHSQKVPPKLMEKTLHMVRIVTQSNSALGPPSISTEVTMLAHRTWQAWTLKAKLLLGLLLLTLMVAGGGLMTYSGWMSFRGEQHRERIPGPAKKRKPKPETHETPWSRTDHHRSARISPLGAGLPTPPLDDRRSPLPAAGRRMPSWNDTVVTRGGRPSVDIAAGSGDPRRAVAVDIAAGSGDPRRAVA